MSKDNKIVILLVIVSLFTFLLALNKYWAPYDEGIVTVGAERILHGEIPYKDFFIIMYPPGQFYLIAFLYKIFGTSLETGRIYTCFIHVLIAMCVFLIGRALTKKTVVPLILWIISLSCLAPRMGLAPFPIWPGMAFSLLSVFLFMKYLEKGKLNFVVFSGLAVGLAALFRHDMACYAFLAILAGFILYRRRIKEASVFILSSFVVPLPVFLYLSLKSAFRDMFESLLVFTFSHHEAAALSFPKPCFNLNMIFHQSLYFIKVNQYYIPLIIFAFVAIFLIKEFLVKRKFGKKEITLFVLLVFGALCFNQVRVRTDPAHLLTSIYPAILLFGFILDNALFNRRMTRAERVAFRSFAILIGALFLLLFVKNVDKSFKNVFRKPYRGDVLLTRFDRGAVYIPKAQRDDIVNTVSFIKANTSVDESIYVGNIVHWRDEYGGNMLLYFLSERLPLTKYYELAPGLTTQPHVHAEIIESLSNEKINIIVLQDIALPEEGPVDSDLLSLDEHIKRNFKQVKKFGKYNIYKRKR
ncbi:MAG: glycosyltransferase family 39 protein [Candidatus Omnitrophica bacterium]|nr:glycosyltransferase family 39 protein [Candidatus Omnitrophota bacterium]